MGHRGNNRRRRVPDLGILSRGERFSGMQGAPVASFEVLAASPGAGRPKPDGDRVSPEVLDRAGVTGGVPGLLKMWGLDERGIAEAPAPGELPQGGPIDQYSAAHWGLEDGGGQGLEGLGGVLEPPDGSLGGGGDTPDL